ncbi:MAG: hypothetical protein WD824_25955 [Cyclobacteriaceae bacterium]
MSRSKKIFAAFAAIFFLLLVFVVYDISTRTTFPGSHPSNNKSSNQENKISDDTLKSDTTP